MAMAKDPICGMEVDSETSEHKIAEDGVVRYFCSKSCKDTFIASNSSWFTRLLEWIARGNQEKYGDRKPSCCDR
jgi:YHS domain-containing protein